MSKSQNQSSTGYNIASFYSQSKTIIQQWKKIILSDPDSYSSVPFLDTQNKGKGLLIDKYIDLMPEPFWGDPENCMAVMINLNPGYGEDDKWYIGRKAIHERGVLSGRYLAFAKKNPYFTNTAFHPAATVWWGKRLSWLHKVLNRQGDYRLPFMTELCPWHSSKWAEAKIKIDVANDNPDYNYIQEVFKAAAYASSHSGTPIISIGKANEVYELLMGSLQQTWRPEDNNLEVLSDYIENKQIPLAWPQGKKKKNGKDEKEEFNKNVYFDYYKKEIDGECVKLLNIWMKGSNHTPSDEFLPIERAIIKYIEAN